MAEEERLKLLEMERTARSEAETALTQLQAIQSITEAALTHIELDDLLDTLQDRISQILLVDTVSVLLAEEDGTPMLVVRAAKGIDSVAWKDVTIPFGQGISGRIVSEQQPLFLNDVRDEDLLDPHLRKIGIRSLLGVPLVIEGRVLGVLHVGSLHYRRFMQTDVQFLQIVADRVALAIDHAHLVETTRAAREEVDIAEAMLRAQDEFLSVAAHELKTPMTSAMIAVQLLLRSYADDDTPDPERVRQALKTIEHQISRLSRLVVKLLETVRQEAGRLTLERAPVNIADLLRTAVKHAEEVGRAPELIVSGEEEIWANVDALRLEQVVVNLLDNAIKFNVEDRPIHVEVTQPTPETIQIAVRDHGLGVPIRHRAHLFERFYQAHAQSHQSGLGLGLFISREIVERHDGQITAAFPVDRGNTLCRDRAKRDE